MAFLAGLTDYLAQRYDYSTFEEALRTGDLYTLHLHGGSILQGAVTAVDTYDMAVTDANGTRHDMPKLHIKMLYPAGFTDKVSSQIKIDTDIQSRSLEPIVSPRGRNFIKNKTIYPLMREQEVLFFTLLDGEIIRGLIQSFARYEITLSLKGREQIVVLRHAIHDVRNKQGHCFLKSAQQALRDWTKSELYIDLRPRAQVRPGLKKTKIKRRRKVIIR